MTDTVYIVIDEDDYEYRDVTCVFSNREDAEKYVAAGTTTVEEPAGTTTAEELYGPVERPLFHPEIQEWAISEGDTSLHIQNIAHITFNPNGEVSVDLYVERKPELVLAGGIIQSYYATTTQAFGINWLVYPSGRLTKRFNVVGESEDYLRLVTAAGKLEEYVREHPDWLSHSTLPA